MKRFSYLVTLLFVFSTSFAMTSAFAAKYDAANPTAKGNKVGQGTVDVAYPQKTKPKGDKCPPKYYCQVNQNLSRLCIFNGGRNTSNTEQNCSSVENFCARQRIQRPENRTDSFPRLCPKWRNSQGQ